MAQIVMTLQEARDYLHEHPYGKLRAIYDCPIWGRRTASVVNGTYGTCVLKPRSKRYGHQLMWERVEKIWREVVEDKNVTEKFTRKAKLATFTNPFIRKCLAADPTKSPYENRLSTGVPIEGKIITLKSIGKSFPWIEEQFRDALKNRRRYHSGRERWRGYDMSVSVVPVEEDTEGSYYKKGDIMGYLSLEYKDCGNGYYYILVNDDEFIGHDID